MKWDGSTLSSKWNTVYSSIDPSTEVIGRLGSGSGATPSLMGRLNSPEGLYVVITDDSTLMNLVVFDSLTGEEMDRAPVNFGDPNMTESLSEQSVLTMNNRLVVVNNTPRSARLKAAAKKIARGATGGDDFVVSLSSFYQKVLCF